MIVALMLESDGPGGAENVLLTLAEGLRDRGHEIVPVGPATGVGWLAREFEKRDFRAEVFSLRRSLDPRCVLDLRRMFVRRGVEIVHGHEFTMAIYGAAAARLAGIPSVITMHGGRYYAAARRRRVAMRWALRSSAGAVAVSASTAADLERDLGLPNHSVHVVPNGHRLTKGSGGRVREELGLGDEDILILAVGNLYPVKGHEVLLRALAAVSTSSGGALPPSVAIAGRGELEEPLRALARELGIADRVHLLGHRDDVADLLDAATIFALPSFSEGLPLALLEAMFAGKSVVASAVGGIPEVLAHRETGLLTEPGSPKDLAHALDELVTRADLRLKLGEAARELAERRYSPEGMAAAYEQVYLAARGG